MSAPADPFELQRFVDAQAGTPRFVDELRAGRKTSHWMWFVFPQIAGLGHSAMSKRFALSSLDEARAYLAHPVLGARLRECVALVSAHRDRDAVAIFGDIDAMKLHSSLTLFARAAPEEPLVAAALQRFFGGAMDGATESKLAVIDDRGKSATDRGAPK